MVNRTKELVESLKDQHYKLVERVQNLEKQACKEHDFELKWCMSKSYKRCKLCGFEDETHIHPDEQAFNEEKKDYEIKKAYELLKSNGYKITNNGGVK